jgi:DNA-nicking Smr family endonuclease
MITLDMHGKTSRYAVSELIALIDRVRKDRDHLAVRFITGQGMIRKDLLRVSNRYELEYYDWDLGTLLVFIE